MPKKKKEDEPKVTKDTKPKFKFECIRCGECCKSETVPIYIVDLENWVGDQTIFRVMHALDIETSEDKAGIFLKKDDDGYCNLYHRDNKACTIEYNKPLFCKSYPLGYNGTDYILKSKTCKGLKAEDMSKEQLQEMRNLAFEDYIAARQITSVLPLLQTLIYNKLIEQSQKTMEKMQEEQGKDKEANEEEKSDG